MKPKIIKADTAGFIVQFDEEEIYYVGEYYRGAAIYKDEKAFKEHVGICYIPENCFFGEDNNEWISGLTT